MYNYKNIIKERKIKQKHVAEFLKLTPQMIGQFLNGKANLSAEKHKKLDEYLGLEIGEYKDKVTQGTKLIVIKNENEIIYAKKCTCCNKVKILDEFAPSKKGLGGKESYCGKCKYQLKKEGKLGGIKKPSKEYLKKYYANNKDEYKDRHRDYRSKNKERFLFMSRIRDNKRRKWVKLLPDSLRFGDYKKIENVFSNQCALTGLEGELHMDHFIPVSWGHGGTYSGNIILLRSDLNISKKNNNPFVWMEENKDLINQEKMSMCLEFLAKENNLTIEEFKEFVFWCENNKRSIEQLETDNKLSLELWSEAKTHYIKYMIN